MKILDYIFSIILYGLLIYFMLIFFSSILHEILFFISKHLGIYGHNISLLWKIFEVIVFIQIIRYWYKVTKLNNQL